MNLTYRLATQADLVSIIEMLSDDDLGKRRERFEVPLPRPYVQAFEVIANDPQQELTVVEDDGELVATFHLSFIQYLTYQGGLRAHG